MQLNETKGYTLQNEAGIQYLSVPAFDQEGVLNCFSTRIGGISKQPYESMNLSLTRPSAYSEDVLQNYTLLCNALGIRKEQVVIVNYCHGDGIAIVDESNCGNGLLFENRLPPCDALITNKCKVALATIHADCTSYLIYDPQNRVIAACHAGWKGTVKKIGTKTIQEMKKTFGTNAEDCIVGIGPNIGFSCFEVDKPVASLFQETFHDLSLYKKKAGGKYLIDLTGCAVHQFMEAGIRADHITVSGHCTYTENDLFYSYRRDGNHAGAMLSLIMLQE